jgi:hypothetical protein
MEQTQTVDRVNSVKIAINAKGQFSGEVKVYGVTEDEAMQKATKKAKELEVLICQKNGLPLPQEPQQ